MKVTLLEKTPNYLRTIWLAARTCTSVLSPVELAREDPGPEEMLRIAGTIITRKHLSVLEHCHMTFAVQRVSRTLLAQYSRHRIGISLSVQSQRYVTMASEVGGEGAFDYITPDAIAENVEAQDVFVKVMENAQCCYDRLKELGIKNEDARFVLPGAAATNFVTSLNLRSLIDVYKKRVAVRGAQWEIRRMVGTMAEAITEEEPWLKEHFESL